MIALILALLLAGWLWSEPARAADTLGGTLPSLDVKVDVPTPVGDVSANVSTASGESVQTAPVDLAVTPAVQANLDTPAATVSLDASPATLTGDPTSTELSTPAASADVSTGSASTRVAVSPAKVEARRTTAAGLEVTLASPAVRIEASTPLATARVEVGSATAQVSGMVRAGGSDSSIQAAPSVASPGRGAPAPALDSRPDRPGAAAVDVSPAVPLDPKPAGPVTHERSLVELPQSGIAGSIPTGVGAVPGPGAERQAAAGWSASSIRPDATPFSTQGAAPGEETPRSALLVPSLLDRLGIGSGAATGSPGLPIAGVLSLFALGLAGFAALLVIEQPRLRPSRVGSPLERPG